MYYSCPQSAMVIFLLVLGFLDLILHGFHNIHALFHLAEDLMLAIQTLSLGSADEKLGTVYVGSSICPGQDAKTCVLQDGILIMKFLPVDGHAAYAIVACEVTTLACKSWNNSVKAGAFVAKSFLLSVQSMKVFCCLWNFVCKQLEGDTAQGHPISSEVKEHGEVDHGWAWKDPRWLHSLLWLISFTCPNVFKGCLYRFSVLSL